jgi:co-chaperonin GroES (HSP10)
MTVAPLHDRIVVARLEDPGPLPGAILIPHSEKEKRLTCSRVEAPDLKGAVSSPLRAA